MRTTSQRWITIGFVSALAACSDRALAPGELAAPVRADNAAERHTVVVNPEANGNGVARTVQEGIDRVASGGTVLVSPGTYEERVVITKGLTLRGIGMGAGPATLRQSMTTNAAGTEAVIVVATAEPVVVSDLTVHHDNIRGLIALREADVTVERVSFEGASSNLPAVGNGVTVIYNAGASGARARAVIRENRFAVGGIGISLGGDVDALVEGNEMRQAPGRWGCVSVSAAGQGSTTIAPSGHTSIDIVGNRFEDCGTSLTGRFNSLIVIGAPGATTTGSVNVVGNTFRTTALAGAPPCPTSAILYEHFSGVIEHNTIVDVVGACAVPNPVRNFPAAIFVGSRVPGVRPADVAVRFNDIAGNAYAGLRIGANQPTPIDATCNWWGEASGPSGVGTGTGNAIVVEAGAAAPAVVPFAAAPIAGTSEASCAGAP